MYAKLYTFDLESAYHKIELPENDVYTAFVAFGKLYQYKQVAEGVKKAVP